MTTYTYNGSIPTEIPAGVSEQDHISNGWKVAPDKPECPEGKEVVWWSYFWVTRDPQPADEPGFIYSWNQDNQEWIKYPIPVPEEILISNTVISNVSTQLSGLTSTSLSALTSTSIPSL